MRKVTDFYRREAPELYSAMIGERDEVCEEAVDKIVFRVLLALVVLSEIPPLPPPPPRKKKIRENAPPSLFWYFFCCCLKRTDFEVFAIFFFLVSNSLALENDATQEICTQKISKSYNNTFQACYALYTI